MKGSPDFVFAMGARSYVLGNLGCIGAILSIFALVTWLVPGVMDEAPWWVWGWIALGSFTVVYFLAQFARLLWREGTYRVLVQDGRLLVQSPDQRLGASFDVALAEIRQLVIWKRNEGTDRYELHMDSGDVHEVHGSCGEALFAALKKLNPKLLLGLRADPE